MSAPVFPSSSGTDEPHAAIVQRLQINWDNHAEKIGEALMRLINCLGSCENVNLSGIDRDLIVYAMAFARCTPAQQPTKPGPDDRALPTYGQIPWDQLGRDVMDAMYAKRSDYPFDQSYYPGHQMVPQINFNSLARIVDKYRYYALASPPAALPAEEVNLPTLDEYRNNLIEECAKIAEPWAGFWLSDSSTEADRAVVAVRTEIAAKIRGLAIPSTSRAPGPLVPWELKCRREVCAAPECDCPAITSTESK